jgi:hypothetical protein
MERGGVDGRAGKSVIVTNSKRLSTCRGRTNQLSGKLRRHGCASFRDSFRAGIETALFRETDYRLTT